VGLDDAERILARARELADPALVARALIACGALANSHDRKLAAPYFAEAADLVRDLGDSQLLGQLLALEWMTARVWDEPLAVQEAVEEGLRVAQDIGDYFVARQLRWVLGWGQLLRGDLAGSAERLREVAAESAAAHDAVFAMSTQATYANALA